MSIPLGEVVSYENVAMCLGISNATRAVARAIAKNSIAVLIPCHREIIRENSQYRWGLAVKKPF